MYDRTVIEMARDFGGALGSTAVTERLFPAAGSICTTERASLKIDSMEDLVCGQQWLRSGLIPDADSIVTKDWARTIKVVSNLT